MSEKRYQVFISSTYADLQAERAVLMQALPMLGCLPCGLEINPATAPAWTAIKKLIDESDYYVLLLGSRYGTLSPSGISYTHMEYVYAATKQKPMLVLMHEAPESRSEELQEKTSEGRRQFGNFRNLLQKGLVAYWSDGHNLETCVHNHLPQLIKQRPSSGWVKATALSNPEQAREIEHLKKRVAELEHELAQAGNVIIDAPLAQGEEIFEITYRCKAYAAGNCEDVTVQSKLTWNQIFLSFAPNLSQPQHEDFMAARIAERLQENALKDVQTQRPRAHAVTDISIAPFSFSTIKTQFRSLGWVRRVTRDDPRTWWQLTTAGEQQVAQLLTVRRKVTTRPAQPV